MIDTGDSVALQEEAKKLGLEVTMFLQTHAHIDHILGLAKVKAQEKYRKTPIYLHPLGEDFSSLPPSPFSPILLVLLRQSARV